MTYVNFLTAYVLLLKFFYVPWPSILNKNRSITIYAILKFIHNKFFLLISVSLQIPFYISIMKKKKEKKNVKYY